MQTWGHVVDASLKTKIKAAHGPGDKQPDVEEGGVKAQPAQKDVYYKVSHMSHLASMSHVYRPYSSTQQLSQLLLRTCNLYETTMYAMWATP